MKNIKLLIPVLAVVAVAVYASAFVVNQWEVAFKFVWAKSCTAITNRVCTGRCR